MDNYFAAAFFLPVIASMKTAIAPSPVTLQAVPKLSWAMYRAIIKPHMVSSKPSMDCRIPRAAMTAPPGTPGAATMVTPSIRMKGNILPKPMD